MILLLLAPLLGSPDVGDEELPIHIEKECGDLDAPLTPVVMLCGVSCVIDDDGNVIPDEIDWVAPECPQDATCRRCRSAAGLADT